MKRRVSSPPTTIALAAALALTASAAAQELPFLLDLPVTPDRAAAVRYTPGSLDRASHVQDRFSLLASDFGRWSGKKLPMLVVLLSREDWNRIGIQLPYGFPVRLPNGTVMTAAWGDAGTVELWSFLLSEGLPALEGTPIRGTADEASSLIITDLLGQIEGARGLLARGGFGSPQPRINDFIAHTLALSAVLNHDRSRLELLDAVFRQLEAAPAEIPGADPTLGGWLRYQGDAYRAARTLAAKRGNASGKLLLKLARKSGGAVSAADLRKRFPELAPWIDAL